MVLNNMRGKNSILCPKGFSLLGRTKEKGGGGGRKKHR